MMQRDEAIRYPDIAGDIMASIGEIVVEPVARVVQDMIYVTVGASVKESKSNLIWTLHNSGGKRICIIHVLQPAQMIPMAMMGTMLPAGQTNDQEVISHRETERKNMEKTLEDYLVTCHQMGVRAEKLHIEMECIEKGIVELISQHRIKRLVMGAAADKFYSKRMIDLKSKKAIYVREHAPAFCHIQFVCKGHLIYTREANLGAVDVQVALLPQRPSTDTHEQSPHHSRSRSSVTFGQNNRPSLSTPVQDRFLRVRSARVGGGTTHITEGLSTPPSGSRLEAAAFGDLLSIQSERPQNENGTRDGNEDDALYDQLVQAMAEAENAKREAFEEAIRRGKAEKDTIDAIRRAKAFESFYNKELRQRKQIEDTLEQMKKQRDKVMEDLRAALEQKSQLENRILESNQIVQSTLEEAEELRKQHEAATNISQFFADFSFSEIDAATRNFDPSLKIGEGGYGTIYKGFLRQTEVAIKVLKDLSRQGPSEFKQEVDVLSKVRHRNIVILIGACPEAWSLIYEYLPNGNLEDRLRCKDNTSPLSWKTRIRIAYELCCVLIFLHSSSIVHGDLKPSNILLDANFVCKLGDFGISRLLSRSQGSSNNTTLCCWTNPKGTPGYIDPEFYSLGELTPKSDVYSFGVILLQLLTGKPPWGISKAVQYALDWGRLETILDPSAGDWILAHAEQLARLALRCCETSRKYRPDLVLDVMRVLESIAMRSSCGSSSAFRGS